jgi:NAD(P)-dependent dehydrogenase (short-subunit alcohol dehydrogenase family)
MRLADRVAIVTGAAQGIGRAVAEVFAQAGATVALVDRDAETGRATAATLSRPALFVEADVSDEAQVAAAVGHVAAACGTVHVLVNCAAVFVFEGVDASPEDWRRSFEVNVMGPALVTKHVVPHMRRAGGGAIVNLSSVAAFRGQKEAMPYCATKAAVVELTRCMAVDLAGDGIRVNSVAPGATWTPQVQAMARERSMTRAELARQPNLGAEHLMNRIADPQEIARAVLFLACDDASFITGTNLMVDGGWTAR